MPHVNCFYHQDTEGPDTDQLPLPRDRLLECRWALSKIDDRCQKMISPQRAAGPRGRQIPGSGASRGRRGRQPGARPSPGPAASQAREPTIPLRGRAGGAHAWEGPWGSREPWLPHESGNLYPLFTQHRSPGWSHFICAPPALLVGPSRAGPRLAIAGAQGPVQPGTSRAPKLSLEEQCLWRGNKDRGPLGARSLRGSPGRKPPSKYTKPHWCQGQTTVKSQPQPETSTLPSLLPPPSRIFGAIAGAQDHGAQNKSSPNCANTHPTT